MILLTRCKGKTTFVVDILHLYICFTPFHKQLKEIQNFQIRYIWGLGVFEYCEFLLGIYTFVMKATFL